MCSICDEQPAEDAGVCRFCRTDRVTEAAEREPEVLGSWSAPRWATNSRPDDDGFVVHSREAAVGDIIVSTGVPPRTVPVMLVQSDRVLDDGGGRVVVHRVDDPEIVIDVLAFSPYEAGRLLAALHELLDALA
jgi:hypothetical protein